MRFMIIPGEVVAVPVGKAGRWAFAAEASDHGTRLRDVAGQRGQVRRHPVGCDTWLWSPSGTKKAGSLDAIGIPALFARPWTLGWWRWAEPEDALTQAIDPKEFWVQRSRMR
ncbi:hypothetical protein [Xanthomonas sacchari]|uniref:hypothetical protein n=1 Tax=Xanthomonas sacchari TaxID=56458 RepID=UPI00225A1CD8|nr:hypothetical protein [Xanthomonas sacchari]